MKKNNQLNVLDTFAGAGGFSLGFQMAGCNIVGAIELDEWASETFLFNHKNAHVMTGDIRKMSDADIRQAYSHCAPDIILGGPPCQGFSICNKNSGDPTDPRNSLFKEFIRVGTIFNPRVMIMENVPNLLNATTSGGIPVVEIIKNQLINMYYCTTYIHIIFMLYRCIHVVVRANLVAW
jgi:DNA (cytosine-5)-methyltransferase 1